ncbi:MAG: hypothetical protein QQN63_03595 [Nitrosopumilus sp.]
MSNVINMKPLRDELFDKYRVFREPNGDFPDGHPVPLVPPYIHQTGHTTTRLIEVEDFYFVLRPTKDPHALKALQAYTKSLEREGHHPHLTSDLMMILDDLT